MPSVGFGTWQLQGDSAYQAVRLALEAGYRHIDTATMYGNEDEVGRALRDSGLDRSEVFVTTKAPPSSAGRERETIAASLRALGVDYVDLWLVHWPPAGRAAPPMWQEFLTVRDKGMARAIGVSNYRTDQIDELIKVTGVAPAVNQIPWSPAQHDPGRLADSRDRGVLIEGYSPLRGTHLRDRVLVEIAEAHQVTVPQVVLRWHVQHGIPVIPKSAQADRIRENFDLFDFSLTDQEMSRVDGLSTE
ncbi:oxidoreductase [Rugosimonospora africana]|uniref:Oxidoreductase n=2 Tax=Rugosimonospora africana TaxID=556532 RepID=A0A8J3VRR2_9ACTN|nr:oxidoreductase [Rugosimonospora africana]